MSKGAIKIPYRPIQENEKPLADRAYRESRRTAIAMYVMAAVCLILAIVLGVVFILNDLVLGAVVGIGCSLFVAIILFIIGKSFSHYPTEIFVTQVVRKYVHDYEDRKQYEVYCVIPSSDGSGTHNTEKAFVIEKSEYDRAEIGSWVCIIKQNRLYDAVYVIG